VVSLKWSAGQRKRAKREVWKALDEPMTWPELWKSDAVGVDDGKHDHT